MNDSEPIVDSGIASEPRSRVERRIQAARDVLRTTIRDTFMEHFGAVPSGDTFHVDISLRVTPGDNWRLEFNPPLTEQLQSQLADHQAARDVFIVGHVHCFRCGSSQCTHSSPPTSLHVFKGFDTAGRPEWQELAQTLLDEKDIRVDQLYANPPRLVARFQFGRELKGRQLAAFGKASLSYSLLAQIVAGYFEQRGNRLAVSLQIVEGRDRNGVMTLKLNPVGHGLDGSLLLEWLSSDGQSALFRAIQIAEQELAKIESVVVAARAGGDQSRANQWMGRVPGVARRLAEALERGGRQGERRTRHVEARRKDQRPVHKALADAGAARIEHCFYDEKAKTFVVVGDRGRAHAFNRDGRHVTSFMMKPASVAFRVRTGRWRQVAQDEWQGILQNIHLPSAATPSQDMEHAEE